MSKIVEKLVCRQLIIHLEHHGLIPGTHSPYRRGHSTETALLKVISYYSYGSRPRAGDSTGLLDLSAAFDTVDHDILIDRLHHAFWIQGAAQTWIESFIKNQTQSVSFAGRLSLSSAVTCGVPQGSVLPPVLFLLYTSDVLNIVLRH